MKKVNPSFTFPFFALVGLLVLGPPVMAAEKGAEAANSPEDLERINVSPLDETGVYHVATVFEKLVKVTVMNRGGPYGPEHTRTLEGWNYDKKTGRLTVKEKVDNEKEMIFVWGNREMPWAWQIGGAISDVKVLIGKEAAVRGNDYEVDEAAGTVQFLKKEHCKKGVQYCISYMYRDQPSKSGAIGNHSDSAIVRIFLGLHPTPVKKADIGTTISTNASPTDKSNIWTVMRPIRSDSIKVGFGRRSVKGKFDWLERGKDFAYDETLATIILLREIPLEEDSWMLVQGVPTQVGRFVFHSALTKGEVKVILDDRLLEEGVGYQVDYEQGTLTIVDKAIDKKSAKYLISASGCVIGNYGDLAPVSRLLQD